jgi:hypothetical protein
MMSPRLYKLSSVAGRLLQRIVSIAPAWTKGRDLRPIEARSFPRSLAHQMNNDARQSILSSIRTHLAASAPYDKLEHPDNHENPVILSNIPLESSLIDQFKLNLESVDGHCIITTDVTDALNKIIADLNAQRIAISDNPDVERWLYATDLHIEELGIAPNAKDIFRFDVRYINAQAAIAETARSCLTAHTNDIDSFRSCRPFTLPSSTLHAFTRRSAKL